MFSACLRKYLLMSFQTWWFKWISQFFLFWQPCKLKHSQISPSMTILVLATLQVHNMFEHSHHLQIGFKKVNFIWSMNFSFIGISQSILATSYVKWIDVWMIFMMIIPFLEASHYQICFLIFSLIPAVQFPTYISIRWFSLEFVISPSQRRKKEHWTKKKVKRKRK